MNRPPLVWCRTVGPWFVFFLGAIACGPTAEDPADAPSAHNRVAALVDDYRRETNRGKHEKAVELLEEMIALDPHHPYPYRLSAFESTLDQDYRSAERLLRALGPDGPGKSYGLGLLATFRPDYDAAVLQYGESLTLYREIGHDLGEGYALVGLGFAQRGRGKEWWDEAEEMFRAAQPVFERAEYPAGVAMALEGLGALEYSRGRYGAALESARQALAIREEIGDPVELAKSWLWIGKLHRVSKEEATAVPALERSLELQRDTASWPGAYRCLIELARAHWRLGEKEVAYEQFREALELATSMGGELRIAWTGIELGQYLDYDGDLRGAIETLRPAVSAAASYGHWKTEARAHLRLGLALSRAGELASARDSLEAAVERAAGHDDGRRIEAEALTELGRIDIANGELGRALLRQLRALELQRELGRERQELASLNVLGVTYYWMGRRETALRYFEELLERAREAKDGAGQQLALTNLGNVLLDDDQRLEEALELLRASIALAVEREDDVDLAFARFNTAYALWRLGRLAESVELHEQALAGFREQEHHDGHVMALNFSAVLAGEGEHPETALEIYATAAGIARERGFQMRLWNAHAGRARVYEKLGLAREALAEYTAALDIIESLRARLVTGDLKMSYAEEKAATYERALAVQWALESKDAAAPESFRLAERARARSLLDLLAESRAALRDSLPESLAAREKAAVDEIGSLAQRLAWAADAEEAKRATRELRKAEEKLQALKLEIRREAPRYSEVAYPQPVALREIQTRVLEEGETLLRYFVGSEQSGLWIVEREKASFHRLAPPGRIAGLVGEFLDAAGHAGVALGSRPPGADEAESLARELHVAGVPAGRRLLVVPDGPLHHLPFEALLRDGRFLIEDHEVVVVPSATALKLMREQPVRAADDGFLGIGEPAGGDEDPRFPPLPLAGQALDRIAALFPKERRVVLKGKTATKSGLRELSLDRFRYVHFATHGWLDPDNPRYFGLRLGPSDDRTEADFLYPEDVFGLRLAAELVVLSACSSGLGELLEGEGLVGMTRGFLYAGTRSVLVSLWDVNDRSTAEFMEAFYRKIAEGQSASGALRSVKLAFLASDRPARRQLYRWAPFVLMGNPTAARGESNRKAGFAHPDPEGMRIAENVVP